MTIVMHITLRADIGGGPEHLLQLVSNMPDTIETFIACPNDEPYRMRYESQLGADKIMFVPHRKFSLSVLLRLAKEIRAKNIDVIHSHGKGAGIYSRLLAVLTKRRCVHTYHGWHVGEYSLFKKRLYLSIERFLGLFTSAAICVSEGERDIIKSSSTIAAHKLKVVDNGVATPELRKSEPESSCLQIIGFSRFDYQKNSELTVEIAKILKNENKLGQFKITVFGQGEGLSKCRENAATSRLGDVIAFPGSTLTPRAALRDGHIFLSTSRWEGMPMAVLEAMSEGLPIVATDVVGNNDVVTHKTTGLLFEPENARSAANAIYNLAGSNIRINMGKAGRNAVETMYSSKSMATKTLQVYETLFLPPDTQ